MARRTIVTGSASGIGRATADLLRARGEQVIGVDLRDAEVRADLGTPAGRRDAVESLAAALPDGVDSVVACAGIAAQEPATVAVNYFGTTALLAGLRPLLARGTDPRAALVASITATSALDEATVAACLDGDEERAVACAAEAAPYEIYPSSKAALARWVRRTCLAPGWADAGIPLNAVGPGVVRTPMTDGLFSDPARKAAMDEAVPMPLNGYAGPETVAAALAWLTSPENTHVTGQLLFVDGGAEVALRGEGLR
ncbi:SDR family oxidoreductase [Streptomyces sulphureus]|uniref:SDR family oxidoreductase n=1 Tax=Streptomyces sulphureus TaxID=47758 RepID=UPI00037CDCB0|nr:SDR family oxidoreductase [Streptomyces sulphureus]